MSIPALLWRDREDGVTYFRCLSCNQGVWFGCYGDGDAIIGQHVGRFCTWCGVAWTSVIQEAQATQRTHAAWHYEAERRRQGGAPEPVWFILRRPDRACDYHDDDFMNSGLPLEDVQVDSLAGGSATKALALLRLWRAHGIKQGCTCEYTCDYYIPGRRND